MQVSLGTMCDEKISKSGLIRIWAMFTLSWKMIPECFVTSSSANLSQQLHRS